MKLALCAISLTLLSQFTFGGERPAWVNSPAEFCGAAKLCAVGEGSGQMSAAAAARNELARIFETKVSSESTVATSASEQSSGSVVSGELSESLLSVIKETTNEVLEGVNIEQNFEGEDRYYAMAVLSRMKAASLFENKMKSLDEENVALFETGRRTDLYRILKNFDLRERLNTRYQILRNTPYASPISYSDVMKMKAKFRSNRTPVSVQIENDELKAFVVSLLLEMDFKVVPSSEAKFDVVGKWIDTKEHLNVKGFEKYTFVFELTAKSKESAKLGSLTAESTQTARNVAQCRERALPIIKDEVINTIDRLNIN